MHVHHPSAAGQFSKKWISETRGDRVLFGISNVSGKMLWETSISVTVTNVLSPFYQECPCNVNTTSAGKDAGHAPKLCVTAPTPLGMAIRDPELESSETTSCKAAWSAVNWAPPQYAFPPAKETS